MRPTLEHIKPLPDELTGKGLRPEEILVMAEKAKDSPFLSSMAELALNSALASYDQSDPSAKRIKKQVSKIAKEARAAEIPRV